MSSKQETQEPSKPQGFQFGLGRMLIVLLAVGAYFGVVGRLFIVQPRIAMWIIAVSSTIVPFVLAIVTLYVLSKRSRSPALVRLWTTGIMLAPLIGAGAIWILTLVMAAGGTVGGNVGGPMRFQSLTNQQLITVELPKVIAEPWVWNELEERLAVGRLSPEEISQTLQVLVDHMNTTKPQGWDEPLHWQEEFVESASQSALLTDRGLFYQIQEAYIPKPLQIEANRVRTNQVRTSISVTYGSTWMNHLDLETELLCAVSQVRLAGKEIPLKLENSGSSTIRGTIEGPFEVGEHDLEIDFEFAIVDKQDLIGLNSSKLPVKSWPTALKSWSQTAKRKFHVYDNSQEIVKLIEHPGLQPEQQISIQRALIQDDAVRAGGKKRLSVVLDTDALTTNVSYKVTVVVDDKEFPVGSYFRYETETGTSSRSKNLSRSVDDSFPEDAKQVDVKFVPDPRAVERDEGLTEIWGRTFTLKGIPLERFDQADAPSEE